MFVGVRIILDMLVFIGGKSCCLLWSGWGVVLLFCLFVFVVFSGIEHSGQV